MDDGDEGPRVLLRVAPAFIASTDGAEVAFDRFGMVVEVPGVRAGDLIAKIEAPGDVVVVGHLQVEADVGPQSFDQVALPSTAARSVVPNSLVASFM